MASPAEVALAWIKECQTRVLGAPTGEDALAQVQRSLAVCKALFQEYERLHEKLAYVQKERDDYYHALNVLLQREDLQFNPDKEVVLALVGKQPPLAELIAELEAGGD